MTVQSSNEKGQTPTIEAIEATLSWGDVTLRSGLVGRGEDLAVGPDAGAWASIPGLPENLPVLSAVGSGWILEIPTDEGALALTLDGVAVDTAGQGRLPFMAGARARLTFGDLTLALAPVEVEDAGGPLVFDTAMWRWVGVVGLVHAMILGLFSLLPPSAAAMGVDQLSQQTPIIVVTQTAPETRPPERSPEIGTELAEGSDRSDRGATDAPSEAGNPADLPNGGETVRHPRRPAPTARFAIDDVESIGPVARMTGAFDWIAGDSPFAEGNGPGPRGPAHDIASVLPGLSPLPGMTGPGRGTCNPLRQRCAEGTIAARLHTVDTGPGQGELPEAGPGGGVRQHARVPTPVPSETVGALSAHAIRQTIRRNIRRVHACYQQGLRTNPDLEGRVALTWMIQRDGVTTAVRVLSNDTGDSEVGRCIERTVQMMTFPQAEAMSGVRSYPFVLNVR
jgi:hypothetical protein